MRLALLCHAPTAATRAARFPADEELDAPAVGRLARRPPRMPRHDRVVTSPARCAVETASALGLASTVEPALRDLSCGRWSGQALDAVAMAEPAALEAWFTDPAAAPHGGETVIGLVARVGAWLDARDGGAILAVTHAAVIRAAVLHALAGDPTAFWRIDVAPLTLATFSGRPGRWTLQGLEPARVAPAGDADA